MATLQVGIKVFQQCVLDFLLTSRNKEKVEGVVQEGWGVIGEGQFSSVLVLCLRILLANSNYLAAKIGSIWVIWILSLDGNPGVGVRVLVKVLPVQGELHPDYFLIIAETFLDSAESDLEWCSWNQNKTLFYSHLTAQK